MGDLFTGKSRREARKAAEDSRQQQQVANDRQLSELRAADQRLQASRRNPRGRRLFAEDKSNLS